jgi:putative peptidoglycan lipid II flippase
LLANPVIALLFYRGGFNQASTFLTAQALQCFALGLPFVSGTRLTATAFYAVQEAKKPVRAANIAILINIVMGAILIFSLQHRGLALGVSIGSMANFFLNFWDYRKMVGSIGLKQLFRSTGKIIIAAVLMGVVLLIVQHYWNWTFERFTLRMVYVVSMIGIGVAVYLIGITMLRVQEMAPLYESLKKKIFQ